MSDIIKFEFDRPVEVALRFNEPRVFPSQFDGGDDRHMFSTTDGRVMYVTPLTSARIAALKLSQGECFFICKRKNGRLTEYEVSRETSEPIEPAAPKPPRPPAPFKTKLPRTRVLQARAFAGRRSHARGAAPGVDRHGQPPQGGRAGRRDARRHGAASGRGPRRSRARSKAAAPVKIPMDRAVVDAVRMVQAAMKECNEQWSDQARQDLVSTILIGAQREGWIQCWGR